MKKLIMLLTLALTVAGSSLCLATDGGDLNKQQKAVEVVIDALDGAPAPEYSALLPLISKENVVTMQFIFDKQNKMTNLTLTPYKAPEQAPAQEEKK